MIDKEKLTTAIDSLAGISREDMIEDIVKAFYPPEYYEAAIKNTRPIDEFRYWVGALLMVYVEDNW